MLLAFEKRDSENVYCSHGDRSGLSRYSSGSPNSAGTVTGTVPETATSGTRFAGSPDAVTRCFSGPTKPCTPQTAPIGLFHFLSPSSSSPAPSYSSVESPVNPAPIFVAFHVRFCLIAASVVFRWNTVMGQGDWSLGKRALGRNSCF